MLSAAVVAGASAICRMLARSDDIERCPVEDHIGAFARGVDLESEAVELSGSTGNNGGGSVISFPPVLAGYEKPPQDLADL
jgi:hypothetical protein